MEIVTASILVIGRLRERIISLQPIIEWADPEVEKPLATYAERRNAREARFRRNDLLNRCSVILTRVGQSSSMTSPDGREDRGFSSWCSLRFIVENGGEHVEGIAELKEDTAIRRFLQWVFARNEGATKSKTSLPSIQEILATLKAAEEFLGDPSRQEYLRQYAEKAEKNEENMR